MDNKETNAESRVVFLFGAGASFGSETDSSLVPVLGNQLYSVLKKSYPNTWGGLSDFEEIFNSDFEKGMAGICKEHSHLSPVLQRDMAKYFFRFFPSKENLYQKMLGLLDPWIDQLACFSLNYERLLELSCLSLGIIPNYYESENSLGKRMKLYYPHGCSHLFTQGVWANPNGVLISANVKFGVGSVPILYINDQEKFNREIEGNAVPPVMSYFNPSKETQSGPTFIQDQRQKFSTLVKNAELVILVGIQVREHDLHIWEPLGQTKASLIYCSGSGHTAFREWEKRARSGERGQICEAYFRDHIDEICLAVERQLGKN